MNEYSERANAYGAGHCWYYKLGGEILKPKAIIKSVRDRNYKGYMASDIQAAEKKPEPQRSQALRAIKDKVIKDYRRDLSRYRELACELRRYRQENGLVDHGSCALDLHTSISLKHNHLFNDFGHLAYLDKLLSYQPDLFDF